MPDYDVKVGVTTVGDTSGADKVDQSIKQVGTDAEQVSQATGDAASKAAEAAAKSAEAAAKAAQDVATNLEKLGQKNAGVKTTTEDVNGLAGAFEKLGNEKLKGGALGLTDALNGLVSGDKVKGLQGLATSFYSLAEAIPLPGAALIASFAITAGIKLWKTLQDDADDAKRSVNELGETVDEEMSRLESWASSEFDLSKILSGFESLKSEIEASTKLADTLRETIRSTFEHTYKLQIDDLKAELEKAKEAGNADAIASAEENIKRAEQTKAIVDNTLKLDALKDKLEAQLRAAELERQALAKSEQIAIQNIERMDALRQQMIQRTGNADATYSSETSARLRDDAIKELTDEIRRLRSTQRENETSWARDNPRAPWLNAQFDAAAEAAKNAADKLELLRSGLLDFDNIAKAAADGQRYVNEEIGGAMSKLDQSLADAVQTKTEIAAAEEDVKASMQGVDQSVRQQAQEVAQGFIEKSDAAREAIVKGVNNLDPALTVVENAGKELSSSFNGLGTGVSESIDASAEVIGEGKEKIQKAIEETAAVAATAGDTFKPLADEFNAKVNDAATLFRSGAQDLATAARHSSSIARQIAEEQATLAQQLAGVRQLAGSALDTANLAISQIKNTR